jgi:tRNA (guanine37-N1)-methyltransferase
MRAVALRVPRTDGERWRRRLAADGRLRRDLAVRREGEWIYLPLLAPFDPGAERVAVTEVELVERRAPRARSYADLAEVPDAVRAALPRAFDVVGEIVLVRLPRELAPYGAPIGAALLRFVPGARRVAADEGVRGPARLRSLRSLAGTGSFRTVVRENGLGFVVDLERAYFSPRLAREHALVAAATAPGERVLDLCCGVGPFALTIAARQPTARIVAVDANPAAIELLRENLVRLGLSASIAAESADAAEFLALPGEYDRAVLNLPHEGAPWLPAVGAHVRPGGTLHYYEIVPRSSAGERARAIARAAFGAAGELRESHCVHEYSPGHELRAHTIRRAPR